MRKLILIIPIVLFFSVFHAEATEGCLVNGYNLLTIQTSKEGLYSEDGNIIAEAGCYWSNVTYISECNSYIGPGIKGDFALLCPLDDYVLGLFIFTSVLGVIYLGRKNEL